MEQHSQIMPAHNTGIIFRTLTKTNINTSIKELFIINETVNQRAISIYRGDRRQSSLIEAIINIISHT
jgi:hypothetical protein